MTGARGQHRPMDEERRERDQNENRVCRMQSLLQTYRLGNNLKEAKGGKLFQAKAEEDTA